MRLLYLIQMVNGARVTRYPRKVTNIAQPSLSAHNSTLSANFRPPHPRQLPHFKSSVIPNQRHLRHRIIRPPLGSCFKSQSASSIALCMTGSNPPSVPHPWHKSATPVLIVIIPLLLFKVNPHQLSEELLDTRWRRRTPRRRQERPRAFRP